MNENKKMREITFKEVTQVINNNISSADALRAEGLEQLLKLRNAKANLRKRELKRLEGKYGSKHSRSVSFKEKMQADERFIRELRRENQRAKTDVPGVDKNSWVIYGYVRDSALEPLSGLTLGLYTAESTYIERFGNTTTDKCGYFEFRIRISAKPDAKSTGTEEKKKDPKIKEEPVNVRRISPKNMVYIHVMGKGRKRLHIDKRPLLPRTNAVDYRDIIIDVDTCLEEDKKTRYLGNSSSREFHDLKNEKEGCRIKNIRFDHRVNFKTRKEAIEAGYDFCAYCFGKDKSKR